MLPGSHGTGERKRELVRAEAELNRGQTLAFLPPDIPINSVVGQIETAVGVLDTGALFWLSAASETLGLPALPDPSPPTWPPGHTCCRRMLRWRVQEMPPCARLRTEG